LSAPPKAQQTAKTAPRDRILQSARDLFYARGIRGVSVDEIAAAAGTNKMTLYRHFQSKDLLIAEYVRLLAGEADGIWEEIAHAHPGDPDAQLKAWIARMSAMLATAGDRGCAVANAAIEIPEKDHPARAIIEAHKTHMRENIAKLCRAGGYGEPDRLADEIFLMLEGSRVNMQSVGICGPGARFCDMANALIESRVKKSVK
jgi:AcrR family transcriptional regulator